MIAGIILTGVFIALIILAIASGLALVVCLVVDWLIDFLGRYVDLKRIVLFVVYLAVTYWMYTVLAECILIAFEYGV